MGPHSFAGSRWSALGFVDDFQKYVDDGTNGVVEYVGHERSLDNVTQQLSAIYNNSRNIKQMRSRDIGVEKSA